MKDVCGKVAFITGGVSGIGFGMAKAFLGGGMKVVVTYRRQDHLEAAMSEFRRLGHADCVHAIALDVSDRFAMESAANEAEARFGPVSILCNNAGVNQFGPVEGTSINDWAWIMSVNLYGIVNGLGVFVPRMKARGEEAHIVNTGSIASLVAIPAAGAYTASKFAVRGLSECLRRSLAASGIGVSLLCPGLTSTNLFEAPRQRAMSMEDGRVNLNEEHSRHFRDLQAFGMSAEEVGACALNGILRNDFYVFSHGEFRDELQEISDEILQALPTETVDPRRAGFERVRRLAQTA